MLEDFLSYIVEELSVQKTDKILLAISGGVDSMVMLDLFLKSGIHIEVAHINHSTRNGASDKDENFVRSFCEDNHITYHTQRLDYKILSEGNFQANARKARYDFFKSIMQSRNLDYLATAHHKDDRWETFVMNLNRKSGLQGLTSLRSQAQQTIRPLLMTTKANILEFSEVNGIKFREDSSNSTDAYTRNKIRHHVTSPLVDIFPDFINHANQSINNLEKANALIHELAQNEGFININSSSGYNVIDLSKIKLYKSAQELLLNIMSPFGFTFSDVNDILATEKTGAKFLSDTHEALYNRGKLIIRVKSNDIKNHITIEKHGEYQLQDGRKMMYVSKASESNEDMITVFYPHTSNDTIVIRSIMPGDEYKPDHMNGKTKKIKKLLTDHKIDRFSKEAILVLEVNGEIKQIIGLKN